MKYHIIFIMLLVVSNILAQSGHSTRFELLEQADSFSFQLQLVTNLNDSIAHPTAVITTAYDPINQYPYIHVVCDSSTADTVWLDVMLHQRHKHGYMTIYHLDHENRPQWLGELNHEADSLSHQWRMPVTAGSIQYVVAMLSAHPVDRAEDKVASLEMTNGSFLYRQRSVFGEGQVGPLPWWQLLTGDKAGIAWESARFPDTPGAYLPVLFYIQR